MRIVLSTVALLAIVAALLWQAGSEAAPPVDAQLPKILVASFGPANVIGFLGHPLGTVVRVTGTAVAGETTRWKADMGKTILNIKTVSGQPLAQPAVFRFPDTYPGLAKPGTDFDYWVYEVGEWSGVVHIPKEAATAKNQLPVANDGFYYRPGLMIVKDNAQPRSK